MRPKNRVPTHPGEVLLIEFLRPLGISQAVLARHLEIPTQRVNEIVKGKRGVSAETAWLLSQAFGTTPEFWMRLQAAHDLASCRPARKVRRLPFAG
ncbi:MAG: HigA family addiction module antidote protein [Planctomycetes bacterium]|nr:HigA family addiction module antidote protein [Planctomycetota bacterium]